MSLEPKRTKKKWRKTFGHAHWPHCVAGPRYDVNFYSCALLSASRADLQKIIITSNGDLPERIALCGSAVLRYARSTSYSPAPAWKPARPRAKGPLPPARTDLPASACRYVSSRRHTRRHGAGGMATAPIGRPRYCHVCIPPPSRGWGTCMSFLFFFSHMPSYVLCVDPKNEPGD